MASPRTGLLLIALSSAFFAGMAVLARTLAGRVPAAELVTLRHVVGVLAMAAWFVARRRGPTLKRPGLLALRGVLGGAAVLTYFIAIDRLGAATATVLNYLSPVYAAVWAWLFLAERPGKALWAGLGLATLGAVLVTLATTGGGAPEATVVGALSGLVSGVFGGGAMATVKAVRDDADAPTVFTSFSLVGLLLAAPVAAPGWVPLDGKTWLVAGAVGVLALTGQLLFTLGMGFTTATAGSATTQLVPVLSWVLSIGLLGEAVRPLAALGALLCVGGVLLGLWRGQAPHQEPRRTAGGV